MPAVGDIGHTGQNSQIHKGLGTVGKPLPDLDSDKEFQTNWKITKEEEVSDYKGIITYMHFLLSVSHFVSLSFLYFNVYLSCRLWLWLWDGIYLGSWFWSGDEAMSRIHVAFSLTFFLFPWALSIVICVCLLMVQFLTQNWDLDLVPIQLLFHQFFCCLPAASRHTSHIVLVLCLLLVHLVFMMTQYSLCCKRCSLHTLNCFWS